MILLSFIIQSALLMRPLHAFFDRSQTSLLTSLNLLWHLHHQHEPHRSLASKMSYENLWRSFHHHALPDLRRLRVILDTGPIRDDAAAKDVSHAWLSPPTRLVSRRNLDFFELALPVSIYRRMEPGAVEERNFVSECCRIDHPSC